MKMIGATMIVLAFAALALGAAAAPPETVLDFEQSEGDKLPAGFFPALTGGGGPVEWVIRDDPTAPRGAKVLVQTSADRTDYRFPLCIYDAVTAKDVAVSVQCKPVSGKVDQACGLIARFQDNGNYYVVRANALEDNVRLYRVAGGNRNEFAGKNTKVSSGVWHVLRFEAKGKHFTVSFDGKRLFEADDETFKRPGKIGLWTKADSVTEFDDLKIENYDTR